MGKKILFIGDEECEPCKKALPIVKKVAEEYGIELEVVENFSEIRGYENKEVLDIIKNPVVPTICEVDENKIKKCVIGYSNNLEKEIKELLE